MALPLASAAPEIQVYDIRVISRSMFGVEQMIRGQHFTTARHSSMPPYSLFETHLDVIDLERSIAFYREIVELELAIRLSEQHVACFWIGGRGKSIRPLVGPSRSCPLKIPS